MPLALFKIIKQAAPLIIPSPIKIPLIIKLLITLIPLLIKDKPNKATHSVKDKLKVILSVRGKPNNLIHSVRDKLKVILSVRGKPSNLVLLVRVKEINFIAIKQGRVKGINYSRIKGQEISHTIKEIPTIKVQ